MKQKKDTISEKITLLNKTILDSMTEKDNNAIVKDFTESGIKILGADFGFVWWKFSDNDEYQLAYKSSKTPYNPFLPREKASHYTAIKTKKPLFDSDIKKENYGSSDISPYMKSFIIIPIYHDNHIYGSLTLCYKKRHIFNKEELALAEAIGHTTAQSIIIHKLFETDVLLAEERLKTEFTANATHELRTPLAIMKGNIDLALMEKNDLKLAQDTLKAVNVEINILAEILKDLALLTSTGQNIQNVINPMRVDITNLLKNIVKRLENLAAKKNIKIKIENTKIKNIFVTGEDKYLEKLFLNIIKNSITYGRNNGNITIEISKEKKIINIKILDDGIGISKEDLPKIFDRFYRGDKAHTHNAEGNHSGLGLAIAKWAAEIHGGEIQVESNEGRGSTFIVILPLSINS